MNLSRDFCIEILLSVFLSTSKLCHYPMGASRMVPNDVSLVAVAIYEIWNSDQAVYEVVMDQVFSFQPLEAKIQDVLFFWMSHFSFASRLSMGVRVDTL